MIEGVFDKLNTNKYFVGFMMIILTIGGRFIISELSEEQKEKIDTPIFRKLAAEVPELSNWPNKTEIIIEINVRLLITLLPRTFQ